MNQSASLLKIDLSLHAGSLFLQCLLLFTGGFLQNGPTPPFVYPFFLILATVTFARQWEIVPEYETRTILIPSIFAIFVCGFCLINELGGTFWAFYIPRWFPVIVRILWMQSVLLFIHPLVFPHVHSSVVKTLGIMQTKGYFGRKLPLTLLAIGICMWFLRSQNISPDGYDWLKHSIVAKDWVRYLREPLGTFLLRLWVLGGIKLFHWDPYISITILDFICGFITVYLLWRVFQTLIPTVHCGFIFAWLLSSSGFTQIFVGNIEIYALLHVGLAFFLLAAVRYIQGVYPAYIPGIAFALLFCTHLSAGWWLPAFITLPFIKVLAAKNTRNSIYDISAMIIAFVIIVISFGCFILEYGFNGNYYAMWEHFWSDEVMRVGTDAAMFHSIDTFLDTQFYLTMLNEYFYMMPAIIPLLLVFAIKIREKHKEQPEHYWLLILTGFYLIYTLVWHPDRAFPADWDIFSGLTIPLALTLGIYLAHLRLPDKAIQYILYQSIAFSSLFLLLQLLRNHFKITEWPLFI